MIIWLKHGSWTAPGIPVENTLEIVASPENVETLDKLRMFLHTFGTENFS